eukprot:Skav232807  [mRNA]  locus=scaffold614:489248:497143:- [translate_table: standard]
MQQLRERAAKIVQHLGVDDIVGVDGVERIRQVMEASPIIKILDNKKVDRRRQKFMRLGRMAGESIESFLNRAEIYRRENQTSPEYSVGSKFYIGHILDAAKLTKRDQALLKAAAGGTLEDEEKVVVALLELADQLEGQAGFPIGRGEATLDNEDKFLVQKAGGGSSSASTTTSPSSASSTTSFRRKRPFFNRRRVREALVAILEGEDTDLPGDTEDLQGLQGLFDDESLDEDEEGNVVLEATSGTTTTASPTPPSAPSVASGDSVEGGADNALMEIYAQEYRARNKVRELKKMRQYFQKEQKPGQSNEHVQKWVKEKQQTDPCFLCGKLGHWSQECPLRRRAPVHASNVTFQQASQSDGREWDLLASLSQGSAPERSTRAAYMAQTVQPVVMTEWETTHDVLWSLHELNNKMIVDLGCMRTVAGTRWTNELVTLLKSQGRLVHVLPEREAFRFGDGHVSYSKFCVLVEAALATVHCLLRISVVSGNCPPLLSKNVCSALGLVIDTSQHVVSSRKHAVRAYGLSQTASQGSYGGHYIIPITEFTGDMKVVSGLDTTGDAAHHAEVTVLSSPAARAQAQAPARSADPLLPSHAASARLAHRGGGDMGKRGHDERCSDGGDRRGGDAIAGDLLDDADGSAAEGFVAGVDSCESSGGVGNATGTTFVAGHGNSEHQSQRCRVVEQTPDGPSNSGQEEAFGQRGEAQGAYRHGGEFPHAQPGVQHGHHLQHPRIIEEQDGDIQMEDAPPADADQESRGNGSLPEVEAQPSLDHGTSRTATGGLVGPPGFGSPTVLQPESVLAGGSGSSGSGTVPSPPISVSQQLAREDALEVVDAANQGVLLPGQEPRAQECLHNDSGQPRLPEAAVRTPVFSRPMKRGEQALFSRGLAKAKERWQLLDRAAREEVTDWTLLEVFAGRATLSLMARQQGWTVLPPQDIVLTGLDLTNYEHHGLIKDLIRAQEPDVVTLSPRCGPWSSWQRLRKDRQALRRERLAEMPVWELVLWIWEFQTARGALVILEQPRQSEALCTKVMAKRRQVYTKFIDQCAAGLKDAVSGKPHKKTTAIQANHSSVLAWKDLTCPHAPGEHQAIEGNVTIPGPHGRNVTVKRSTLAAEWPAELCSWLLSGAAFSLEVMTGLIESAPLARLGGEPFKLHLEPADERVWHAVPVESEANPDGALRQQLTQQADFKTKYDYITFRGESATFSRKIRNTLAHLHVALGHIGSDKLARMLKINGAKAPVLQAVKDLDCAICKQVQAPTPAPKAAFARPTGFNQRVVMDTFFVWDANNFKYAVTHLLDAFSLYQIAICAVSPSASTTTHLVRDRWIAVFGPPQTLMSDGGTEFGGSLEMVLKAFQVYHDIVPPTAHWRMALGERHGAVLKLMVMKVIKEKTIMGLDEMQSATVSATAARNLQVRLAGYSPMQRVFGRENPMPGNLMDVLENGHMNYQITDPATMEESFRRSLDIRQAAEQAFQWLQTNEALRRAATSKARLPKLETLVEGAMIMFWEPPANRRGLHRRLQDDTSWVGPALVVALERKDGAIKRVWARYRTKLKGLPLEFVRLAVAEEVEAHEITMDAFQELEDQLRNRTVTPEIHAPPDDPPTADPQYPILEFSDEEAEVHHPDEDDRAALLDDVPMAIHRARAAPDADPPPQAAKRQKTRPPGEPHTWPFRERQRFFQQGDNPVKAAQRTEHHLQLMKDKLKKPSTRPQARGKSHLVGSKASSSTAAASSSTGYTEVQPGSIVPADVFVNRHLDPLLPEEGGESEAPTDDEEVNPMSVAKPMRERRITHASRLTNVSYQTLISRFAQGRSRPNLLPLPASPNTTVKVPRHFDMLPEMPIRMAMHLDEFETDRLREEWARHEGDFWMWQPQQQELWRVHKRSRYEMFVPHTDKEPVGPLPPGLTPTWFRGHRSTVVHSNQNVDIIVDNYKWPGWNAQQHLVRPWIGVTRFWMTPPDEEFPVLANWMDVRAQMEHLWREGCNMVDIWKHYRDTAQSQQVHDVNWMSVFTMQSDVVEMMDTFAVKNSVIEPRPVEPDAGYLEVEDDVQDLPTGKVRLELRWHQLSPKWKDAFVDPIKEAFRVYFQYDAVEPIFPGDDVDFSKAMPSRLVLVNKTDPRNCNPRWIVLGHLDSEAGQWETEAPTAPLVAHNLLCFFAAQFGWNMLYGDISAAFLQGENLDPARKVIVAIPRGYPDFVRLFFEKILPPGALTSHVRFVKGGFGLAESPRLWFRKLAKTLKSLGAKEWSLVPGVFSVFVDGEVVAMVACHVDDIRMIGHPTKAQHIWDQLKKEFTFGEWREARAGWTKFCGRYEIQLEDGTVEVQMDEYSDKVEFPPKRPEPVGARDVIEAKLTDKEKKWIGHVCGQLNWLARQCRADLLFGVSRVQQLAGVDDPKALEELYILVERAKQHRRVKFSALGCSLEEMLVLAASDASFGSMPRHRSQGGTVVLLANPKVLEGKATAIPVVYGSGLIKRVVRSSLAAEVSQAAEALEYADFVRAVIAEAVMFSFSLRSWLPCVAQWRLIAVLDSRTGYDLLNSASHGEDKRLAIDVAAIKEALYEDAAARCVRWVPGYAHVADDLTKLTGNGMLMEVLFENKWSLRDTDEAKDLRAEAATRKRRYRQRQAQERQQLERDRRLQKG